MIQMSLVIPAYNEEHYLPRLLDSVDAARGRYGHGPAAVEVIVVDNLSTDRTADIAAGRGCRVVREPTRNIGAVRNAGVAVAAGEVIVFTDADNVIHPETFNGIDGALASPGTIAGASGVHMERMSFGIAVTFAMMLPMIWATGMDTGVVFCRRSDFLAVGGYDTNRLFGEDVELLWSLRKLGRRRGQRLVRLRRCKAVTSTRKFDQYGEWHFIGHILRFFAVVLFPKIYTAETFARRYWYGDGERGRVGETKEIKP